MSLLTELLDAVSTRRPVVVATVIDTDRSVPRRPGAKMLVFADGSCRGTVGGGEMEARVRDEARAALVSGVPRTLSYTLLDPATGDPGVCGGRVDLFLEPFMPATQLLVVGAGHVGRSLVELAQWLELDVLLWDDRPQLFDGLESPGVRCFDGPIAEVADHIDQQTVVVLVTRNPELDAELLPVLLATATPLVGVMGSARRWATTRKLLVDAGVSDHDLAKVRTPVGIDIGAESPKEIAISVLAQVIGEGL